MENLTIRSVLKDEKQYKAALKKMEELWDCPENSAEADLLEVLSILVEQYETKHYSIENPDPIEIIKYEMEERGLNQKDLVKYFGTKSRVSEVLNRKKPLTLKMIKALYKDFGIPADILLSY